MAEEPKTPDLVEITREAFEALNRRDLDAATIALAPDAVFQGRVEGMQGRIEGAAAFREFWEEWSGTFEAFKIEVEDVVDLGDGVVLVLHQMEGRPAGSSGLLTERGSLVCEWVDGMVARFTAYIDIDEGRAAAERLAESRG